MKKYYTKLIPEEVLLKVTAKGFEVDESDPRFGITYPTYAEVLDWMMNNGMLITINKDSYALEIPNNPGTLEDLFDFTKALDEAIILALDLYENE